MNSLELSRIMGQGDTGRLYMYIIGWKEDILYIIGSTKVPLQKWHLSWARHAGTWQTGSAPAGGKRGAKPRTSPGCPVWRTARRARGRRKRCAVRTQRTTESDGRILKVMRDLSVLWLLGNIDQNRTCCLAECQLFFFFINMGILFQLNVLPVIDWLIGEPHRCSLPNLFIVVTSELFYTN